MLDTKILMTKILVAIDAINSSGIDPSSIDYTLLSNKPSIEGVTLVGNRDIEDLGIEAIDYINFNWN